MTLFPRALIVALSLLLTGQLYSQTINTRPFDKVIISPFIEATFIEGDQERVEINRSLVDADKLHVESKNGTLRIYLDGAKEIPRNPREKRHTGENLYPARAVTATVYYKKLEALSLRGEERFSCPDLLTGARFSLTLYGESVITFDAVDFDELNTTIYGESAVEIKSGTVRRQTYTCYGEGKVNTTGVTGTAARLTAYGESEFNLNVSDRIKITSFGEAKLRYKGTAQVVKGIHVGGVDVTKVN